jgi:hypothetical protein
LKAAPEAQLRLLDLQELDTALDRLARRRSTLPELAEIDTVTARLAELRDVVVAVQTDLSDLAREERRAERDVDQVRTRIDRDQKRLDSGQVSSARDLENLQSEVASLHRRQADLEDVVLEIMERREEHESRLHQASADVVAGEQELAALAEKRDAGFEQIDQEAGATKSARAAVAGDVPADLLGLYEKLRGQFNGVGAAALLRGQCQGCHLALNTVELNNTRSAVPEEIIRCEECRRILVRTPESGL